MTIRKVINLFVGVFAAAVLLTSNAAFAEATLPEVYQAVQSGQMAKADAMMKEVLQNHPNSAKAHYVAADIHIGLKSTLNIARNQLKNRADVRLELGDLPLIECAPSQIDQVFLNLIVNAAQAMPEGKMGLIDIRTHCNDQQAWIEVQDNGPGIPPEILKKIFDPFFTTKDPGTGTGLGLSVSQNIIQQHGGTLAVDSTVGVGTTFTVTLPIKHPAAQGST